MASLRYDDYAPKEERDGVLSGTIDLSMVENPWGASPKAMRFVKENLRKASKYFPASSELLEAIAKLNGVRPENVMLTDGADGALTLCFMAFARMKKVLVPLPAFPRFHYYCALASAKLIPQKLDAQFKLDTDFFRRKEKGVGRRSIFALSSPNNPTGIPVPNSILEEALTQFERVIVDEALFCFGESASELVLSSDNLLVARSFSKIMGLAGLRIGYLLGSKESISTLTTFSSPFKVSSLSQLAALGTLNDREYLSKSVRRVKMELNRLAKELKRPSTASESRSLSYLAKLESKDASALRREKIAVTTGHHFDYLDDTFARISVGTKEQNEKLLSVLS